MLRKHNKKQKNNSKYTFDNYKNSTFYKLSQLIIGDYEKNVLQKKDSCKSFHNFEISSYMILDT